MRSKQASGIVADPKPTGNVGRCVYKTWLGWGPFCDFATRDSKVRKCPKHGTTLNRYEPPYDQRGWYVCYGKVKSYRRGNWVGTTTEQHKFMELKHKEHCPTCGLSLNGPFFLVQIITGEYIELLPSPGSE